MEQSGSYPIAEILNDVNPNLRNSLEGVRTKNTEGYVYDSSDREAVISEILRESNGDSYFFLNEGRIRENVSFFERYFLPESPGSREVAFALKALPLASVLSIMAEEGMSFDCASGNEIRMAFRQPYVHPRKILFNNPVKTSSDIQKAHEFGVRYFTVQSRDGIQAILEGARNRGLDNVEIAVRVATPHQEAGNYIDLSSKFGCRPDQAVELLGFIRESGARTSLAMHTGSQNPNPNSFVEGIELLYKIADQFTKLEKSSRVSSLNLGGGFPVNYFPEDHFDLRQYMEKINEAINKTRQGVLKNTRFIIEPGRAMVAEAGDLAVSILEVDEENSRLYVNGGIYSNFIDAALYGWKYNCKGRSKDGRRLSDETKLYTVFGRTCDTADKVGVFRLPKDLRRGDYVFTSNAGAYMSIHTPFNGFEAPTLVRYNASPRN